MLNLSEALLARLTDPDRAAAIYGDLTELAVTRGRLWFWLAYTRMLFTLTWRIVLALCVADIARQVIFDLFHLYMRSTPAAWRTSDGPYLLNSAAPLLACIMSTLWLALPFAAVRYGLRDRFVQLTAAIAFGTTIAFLFLPWASLLAAMATIALAATALISRTWRKPFEVLVWTAAAGVLTIAASDAFRLHAPYFDAHGHTLLTRNVPVLLFQASLLAVALVCSQAHTRLLPEPTAD